MRLNRHQVPLQETWNLNDLYPTDAEWEGARQALTAQIPQVTAFKGRLGESADTLLQAVSTYEGLLEQLLRLHTYSYLNTATDGKNPAIQERAGKANGLYAQFEAATAFLRSELLDLPEGRVEGWLAQNDALAAYGPFLQNLLTGKPYLLHPETEAALAALGEVLGAPHTIYERAKASDVTCQPVTLPDGTELDNSLVIYDQSLESSPDVNVRRAGYRSFSEGLGAFQNTLAATFATEIKKNVVIAKLRNFPSATAMHLHEQQVTEGPYQNILDVIFTELAPHMRRYAELRKRVLGLDHLLYCDLEAPLDPGFDPAIKWAEGAKTTLEALSILGPEYAGIMERAIKERWVDFSDNVGKRTGAFCTAPYGGHPYVMMTWSNQARNMFTLGHELGHAGHLELAGRHQRLLNAMPSMFFIEVPSTLNELLVGDKLISEATDGRMKRWVIMALLRSYHHNFVRHLLEGELLRRIYALAEAGESITAGKLSATQGGILSEFWGDSLQVDAYAKLTWMRQPHYYMGLYPYTYAAGLTASTAIAQSLKEEGRPAIERWLDVLKAGGSKPPMELMKMAGVDLTTTAPIKKAVAYVGGLVDELERLF
jgi:oligoendopeptidase F